MKEIGGYFELEKLIDNPYHKSAIKLNSGRSALAYLIMAKNIKKIYLPLFLCNTVKDYISSYNVKIEFYNVDENFEIKADNIEKEDNSYLYIVNYYGQLSLEYIKELQVTYKNIIIDNTHDFFSQPINGVDTIYSCRKFFGVPDGAYLYTNKISNKNFHHNKVINKLKHIVGRSEVNASSYYNDYIENDLSFEEHSILLMSKYSQIVLGAIDYKEVQKIRNSNFIFLNQNLSKFNELNLKHYSGPYCYPLMIKNSKKIREKLIKNKVYIPILWEDSLEVLNVCDAEIDFVTNILPLPCDQRYNVDDMKRILNLIMEEF